MRILIVKLSSFGDILHVLPAAQALYAATGARVDWAVHPEFAPVVRLFSFVSGVIEFPRRGTPGSFAKAVRFLRQSRYDMVVDLHGLMKSAIVTMLAKGDRKIGPSYSRECSALFYPERAGRMHRDCHAALQAFDTLDYLGIPRPSSLDVSRALALPSVDAPKGSPLVAVAPVSRWDSKNWPCGNFAKLVSMIRGKYPASAVAIIGGKADFETGEKIRLSAPEGVHNMCGSLSIAQSVALLGKCDLLVSNDSGPVHMASAAGTRTVVLFGPTSPGLTGPCGGGHRIVSKNLPCSPCLKQKCPRGTKECLLSVTPEEVFAAIAQTLEEGRRNAV